MSLCLVIFLVLMATSLNLVLGIPKTSLIEEQMELEARLKFINKPAVKSFLTKEGDILDCIEIKKQLAFDHPLLKNHSIQMKPSSNIQRITSPPSTTLKALLELTPKNIKCPKGTVIVRRVQKEDLLIEKLSALSSTKLVHNGQENIRPGHELATIVMREENNRGISGYLNTWRPKVGDHQYSSSSVYLQRDDGSVANGISAGWFVNKFPSQENVTRIYGFWTRDSGKTGCFNMECPGFVQTSHRFSLGMALPRTSTYHGSQFQIIVHITQDAETGNWWVKVANENLGYYPNEIFTTLVFGATSSGWGGEIYSTVNKDYPGMGSGHFPEEKLGGAAFIRNMKMLDNSYLTIYPQKNKLRQIITKKKCFRLLYLGDLGRTSGHTMYFGGPPGCN